MAFSEKVIQLIANAKIEAAMEDGKFDNLPGFGKPFDFDPSQYDPHWWVRRKIEREQLKHLFNQSPKLDSKGK